MKLTDRDDGVEAAVPDVHPVAAQLRHGVDAALAGEVRHLLVDVGRVGLLGEVGARSEHAHPGDLRRGPAGTSRYIYNYLHEVTFSEKATWNCVEKYPPEEKPLMAMVSGLMLRLSRGPPAEEQGVRHSYTPHSQ